MSKAGVASTQEFRKPRKRKRVVLEERVVDGVVVVGKECTICDEWKPLESGFYNDKRGLGRKEARCKGCRYMYYQQEENKKRRIECCRKYYKENKEKHNKLVRNWREENKERYTVSQRNWYQENKEHVLERTNQWRKNNRDKVKLINLRRRARKKYLPDDFTSEQLSEILAHFDGRCALTGDIEMHWDHAIPLATGHVGTTYGNMIPLRGDLNFSKNDSNIFEWFEANRQRFELSQDKFDRLIEWLAAANDMTVEEYRDYVYWCHANPVDVLESEAI